MVVNLRHVTHLDDANRGRLEIVGFGWFLQMLHIWPNHGLLIALAEWWNSEHNNFHLPIIEATITLEDVYHILQVSSHGDFMRVRSMYIGCIVLISLDVSANIYLCVIRLLQLDPYRGKSHTKGVIPWCDHFRHTHWMGAINHGLQRLVSCGMSSMLPHCIGVDHRQKLEGMLIIDKS